MRNVLTLIWTFPRRILVLLIALYQHTFSPDHGPLKSLYPYGYCPHSPTCSQYTKEVIQKRGAVIGTLLGIRRILSCHPWAKPDSKRLEEVAGKL